MNTVRRTFARILVTCGVLLTILTLGADGRTIIRKRDAERQISVQQHRRVLPIVRLETDVLHVGVENGRATLWLSVRDERLEPLKGLRIENLRVVEAINGKQRTIPVQQANIRTRHSGDPLYGVLVRDNSASMSDRSFALANAAIAGYLDHLSDGEKIAIVDFGRGVTVRHPFTNESSALRAALGSRLDTTHTAFFDGLWAALALLDSSAEPGSLRYAIALTDGRDNASSRSADDVIRKARDLSVPLFTIAIGEPDEDVLRAVSHRTRGEYFVVPSAAELAPVYAQIRRQLDHLYVLSFSTQAASGDVLSVTTTVEYVADKRRYVGQTVTEPRQVP